MTFVLDASITFAWCFEDEATPETDAILETLADGDAIVPRIWPLEVANVLLVAERRDRISESVSARFINLLGQLPIAVDPTPSVMGELLAMGRSRGLSAYDASYLLLAERTGLPLATADKKLLEAAQAAGVELFTPHDGANE